MVANEDRIDMMDPGGFGTGALQRFCCAKHSSVNDCQLHPFSSLSAAARAICRARVSTQRTPLLDTNAHRVRLVKRGRMYEVQIKIPLRS